MRSSLGFYLGYNYFIDYNGKVFQARDDREESAHTIGPVPNYYNRNSIGIALRGDTNKEKQTEWQERALKELIDKKKLVYSIPNNRVKGHRELSLSPTDCPGKFAWSWLCKNYPD